MTTANKQTKPSEKPSVEHILTKGTPAQKRALFEFSKSTPDMDVLFKFRLWSRWFFPQFTPLPDAPFHRRIDEELLALYRGDETVFIDIAFRGAAKTTRTKLFVAYCIANDADHTRRYIKVLAADGDNAKQIVTDVYNILINIAIRPYYPEIFQKTEEKREETMASFTTSTGVRMQAESVGMDQRGDVQEAARPDFLWFDDFETKKTLRSAVTTQAIWENMDEAVQGLSKTGTLGASLYNCNYTSERGNVHRLVTKYPTRTLITPIHGTVENNVHIPGPPAWEAAHTMTLIETILANADDAAGDYLCTPSAGHDIFFDRTRIDRQAVASPKRTVAGFKIFHEYDPSHRYGIGADIGGGVGLDHSASVIIDFTTTPSRVVATYKNNVIKPDTFGHELIRQAEYFNYPVLAPENNKFDMCIGVLKHQNYPNIYFTEIDETRAGLPPRTRYYGWNTNLDSKPRMLFELAKAIHDGHLELSDPDLIAEARSYTRDDLMDKDQDVRLTTRHFDLLIACAIAYQMRNHAKVATVRTGTTNYQQPAYERSGLE